MAAALGGCATAEVGGPHRSAAFASGSAPEPTIATTVVACVGTEVPPGAGDGFTAQFNALARTAMPSAPVPLSPSASGVLCNTIAAHDAFHESSQPTPGSAAVVIRELAQATGAKSIAIPVMRLYGRCQAGYGTVRDSTDRTMTTAQGVTQTCGVDRRKDVGLFLFSGDGTILYRSTKKIGVVGRGPEKYELDPEPYMNEVLANVPATFSAPAQLAAEQAPAASPVRAAPPAATTKPAAHAPPGAPGAVGPKDPKIDDAIGALNSKAPADCKKFAKAMCRSTSVPDGSRLQLCSGYVASINQMVQQQGANAVDACKAMAKSAPTQ